MKFPLTKHENLSAAAEYVILHGDHDTKEEDSARALEGEKREYKEK